MSSIKYNFLKNFYILRIDATRLGKEGEKGKLNLNRFIAKETAWITRQF